MGAGVKVQFVSVNKESHVLEVPEVRKCGWLCLSVRCLQEVALPKPGEPRAGGARGDITAQYLCSTSTLWTNVQRQAGLTTCD